MSSAVVRREMRDELARYSDKLATWGVNPDQFISAALMAATKVPQLFDCTPASMALALMQCAQSGLEIGRTAHLVPFKGAATFVPDYKGLIELAVATRAVAGIRTRCVYEGEDFSYTEHAGGADIRHAPRMTGNGGTIMGAYAIADLRGHRWQVEWMTADEIEAVRRNSRQWSKGPLPDWYARKTVVRRLCKTLPSSPKLHAALRHDDAEDVPEGSFDVVTNEAPITIGTGRVVTGDAYGHGDEMPTPEQAVANARRALAQPNPYGDEVEAVGRIVEEAA